MRTTSTTRVRRRLAIALRSITIAAVSLLSACDTSTPPGTGGGGGAAARNQMPPDERRVVGSGTSAKGGVGGQRGVGVPDGIWVVNRLPIAFVRGETPGLEVLSEHARNLIIQGETEVEVSQLADTGVDRVRRVEDIRTSPDVQMVIVDVGPASKFGMTHPVATAAGPEQPPVLVDEQGQKYLAVGYASMDMNKARLRYLPGSPIAAAKELPTISKSRTDQKLWLIFLVTTGKKVRYFGLGNKAVAEFNPTFSAEPWRGLE
jgi:hypothetical protein